MERLSAFAKAVFTLTALITFSSANAQAPAVCVERFTRGGAVPGTPNCVLDALTSPANLANFTCSASRGVEFAECFCNSRAEEILVEKNPPECPAEGNPINVASGNKYQLETDYQGVGRFPLTFERHYNSLKPFASRLGRYWRHGYDTALTIDLLASPAQVRVNRANGVVVVFSRMGTLWLAEPDVLETLVQTSAGFILTTPDNLREEYDNAGRLLRRTHVSGQSQRLSYAPGTGLLESVSDPFGRRLGFEYAADGRLITVIDPEGNRYRYEYDANGNLDKVIYPDLTATLAEDNEQRLYLYEDANFPNHLTGIIDETGARFASWGYDAQGRGIFSEHNNGTERVDIAYNADGTTTVTDQLGAVRTYSFEVTFGVARTNDVQGDQCTSCGTNGRAFTYDANGFVASQTDFNGNVTTFIRDSRGLELTRTEAFGTPEQRTITTRWHPEFRLPLEIVEPNLTTTFGYDANGNLLALSETDTSGQDAGTRTTTFTYDANGLVLTVDGQRTDVDDIIRFSYDAQGNLASSTNPLGQVTEFTGYDANGRLLSMRDPNGVVTRFSYDARGRLLSREVDGTMTTFEYDGVGQITRITLPNGAFLGYRYDGARRLTAVEDSEGNRIQYTLDNRGNRIGEEIIDSSNTLRRTQSRVFDQLSRLTESITANNQVTRFTYDGNGNQTGVTDALNRGSQSAFDALNRLISLQDPESQRTQLSYDARDNLTSVTDARGLTTRYTFDGFGNLLRQESPDSGITTYTYDAAGNRISQTDARGIVTTLFYDALNRLSETRYPDSQFNVRYRYDQGPHGVGRLTTMTDSSGETTYQYDARGNLIAQVTTSNGTVFTTAYAYDSADNLIQTRYPSRRIVDTARDGLGRIARLTTRSSANGAAQAVVDNVRYLPFGPVTSYTYGNGLSANDRYDQDYRLVAQDTPNVLVNSYTYDAVNNILDITDGVNGENSQRFGYDPLDRLSTERGGYGERDYQYDAVGNRLSRRQTDILPAPPGQEQTPPPQSQRQARLNAALDRLADKLRRLGVSARLIERLRNRLAGKLGLDAAPAPVDDSAPVRRDSRNESYRYSATAHQLIGLDTERNGMLSQEPHDYDAVGNLIGRGLDLPIAYVYGDHNRLTAVVQNGMTLASYRYNGLGQRTVRIVYNQAACQNAGNACADPATIDARFIERTVIYHYDLQGQLLGESVFNPSSPAVNRQDYLWLDNRPVATGTGAALYYVHSDQLNTPRRLTDQAQTIVWRWDADAFGQGAPNNDPDGDGQAVRLDLRFPGQLQMDAGLVYNYFRDYDPTVGRYVQSDPIGLLGGINSYGYVGQNPLTRIDPTGTIIFPINVGLAIFGATVGGIQGAISASVNGGDVVSAVLAVTLPPF